MASGKKGNKTNAPESVRKSIKNTEETLSGGITVAHEVSGKTQVSFPIVGIGASAGGLAAFEAFFSGMPADTDPGMAFVLVQHLAPDHKSILTELIQRYTRMHVTEVEDGMLVQPNCAYIIPPNRDMAFLHGALQLLEPANPRGQRMPIDFFFRSLAHDQHERAICIVLSGTGSDGTLGVRAIKGEGGMAMAQNPESTEYDGMPRSALSTGLVDYELPAAEMAEQLINYVAHAFGKSPWPASIAVPKNENSLKKIFILLRAQTGHDFSLYKPNTINRRIERRMAVHQILSIDGYIKFLQQTPAEVEALFRDLLIGVTNFFRDTEAFNSLEQLVIPKLFAGKPAGSVIRIWVPGCSTGEEAYSIAILLQEHTEVLKKSFTIQVFATDIDSQAIATARAGLYPASIAADISQERLVHFFSIEPGGGAFRIHKSIRDMLVFSEQDIIKDPPFSKLNLISCRNLLIYMGVELQKKLIPLFHYALSQAGMLFLGTSETVGEFGDIFDVLDRKYKLYQRKEDFHGIQRSVLGKFLPAMTALDVMHVKTAGKAMVPRKLPMRELTEHALLQQIAPAGALVNGQGNIFYLYGRTGMYLELAQGEPGINNILKMAREGLRRDLTTALHKAIGSKEIVRFDGLRVKTNSHYTSVNLTIRPVINDPETTMDEPLFIVIFEEARHDVVADSDLLSGISDPATEENDRIVALKQELRAKEEYLQTTNEELETSNEELKSSNEEMQSVNEELQSTNEELETSKEELQSLNEELATVNTELQTKVLDLSRVNNDMNNLLAGTGIGTVFVDHQLRILRFTPTITQIINLILSDMGRPVNHIVSNLVGYDNLVKDIRSVLDTLIPKQIEVQTHEAKWYTMNILPYRTMDNVIEGAVITFVDISDLKRKDKELLQLAQDQFNKLFEQAPIGIALIHSLTGHFYEVNPMFAQITGRTMEEMLQINWMSITHPDDIKPVLDNMALLNNGKTNGFCLEKRYLQKDGTIVWVNMTIAKTKVEDKTPPSHLCMVEDITERKMAQEFLRKANDMLRLAVVVRDANDAITVQDLKGRIIAWNPGAERLYGWSEAEALMMNISDRVPEKQRKKALADLVKLSQAKILTPYLTQRISKDCIEIEVWVTSTALVNEDGQMYAVATTERMKL